MPAFVLDNSVTMAWLMPDEHDDVAQRLLDEVVANGAIVPTLWRLEIANTLLIAVRRRRISVHERTRALQHLGGLDIVVDTETESKAWGPALDLADRFSLSVYDACYLELAQRRTLPLATLDNDLRAAGKTLGISLPGD